jgi:GR25 family glycosyltransferase involved in LPS biosynthesis
MTTLTNENNQDESKIKLDNINFYFINLDKRPDRLDHVTNELKKINLTANRYKAIDDNSGYNINFGKRFNDGQKNCFLSHYLLIKEYETSNNKILGIFEDDIVFCDDFLERFKYIEKSFNFDWDIFYLSSFYHLNDDSRRWHQGGDFEKTNIKYIHRVYGSFCTHSYLVNPNSIPKIIKLLDEIAEHSYAIDHSFILIQPKLNCYSFTPGMTTQFTNESDTDGGLRDQTVFKNIVGDHYYIDKLENFNYEEYFKNY